MPSIINATTTNGVAVSGDNSGALALQTNNGTTAVTVNTSQGVQFLNSISVGNATPTTSGAGITFPATQSASTDANTLDDYEEGTWTPSVLFGGAAVGQSGTFSGFYTKIGNQVFVTCLINLSARGSSTGGVAIGGLPFTTNSNVNYRAISSTVIWANFASTYVYMLGIVGASYTTIDIYALASANTSSVGYQPTQADLTNTTQFRISITYQV